MKTAIAGFALGVLCLLLLWAYRPDPACEHHPLPWVTVPDCDTPHDSRAYCDSAERPNIYCDGSKP